MALRLAVMGLLKQPWKEGGRGRKEWRERRQRRTKKNDRRTLITSPRSSFPSYIRKEWNYVAKVHCWGKVCNGGGVSMRDKCSLELEAETLGTLSALGKPKPLRGQTSFWCAQVFLSAGTRMGRSLARSSFHLP